jgi:hypothetical protein
VDGAADDKAAAPSPLPDPEQVPKEVAQEILRQAQKLIETQIAASTVLDSKISEIARQSTTLSLAALAGAAASFGKDPWLPPSAGFGLVAAALAWFTAARLAFKALNAAELDHPARRPWRLWRAGIADQGEVRTYALIAAELDAGFVRNAERAKDAARRYRRVLVLMTEAPLIGALAATLHAAFWSGWWPPIPILLVTGLALLPAAQQRFRDWLCRAEGLDQKIGSHRVADKRVE